MMIPEVYSDIIGLVVVGGIFVLQYFMMKKQRAVQA